MDVLSLCGHLRSHGTYCRGVNPGVLAEFLTWPSYRHLIIPSLQLAHSSPVTIPQVVAANENVFSVNLPGKITDK